MAGLQTDDAPQRLRLQEPPVETGVVRHQDPAGDELAVMIRSAAAWWLRCRPAFRSTATTRVVVSRR